MFEKTIVLQAVADQLVESTTAQFEKEVLCTKPQNPHLFNTVARPRKRTSDAAIYARVSTSDQDVSWQLDEAHEHLERLGVKDIEEYPEIVSGAADTDTREVYNQLLDDVEFPGMEDRLVEFWASADEYWDAVGGDPPRPH